MRASFDALAADALDEVVVILVAYSTENSEEPRYIVTHVEPQALTHFRAVTLAVTLRYMSLHLRICYHSRAGCNITTNAFQGCRLEGIGHQCSHPAPLGTRQPYPQRSRPSAFAHRSAPSRSSP